jgi:hypothetical protein
MLSNRHQQQEKMMDLVTLRYQAMELMLRHTQDVDAAARGAEKMVNFVLAKHVEAKAKDERRAMRVQAVAKRRRK